MCIPEDKPNCGHKPDRKGYEVTTREGGRDLVRRIPPMFWQTSVRNRRQFGFVRKRGAFRRELRRANIDVRAEWRWEEENLGGEQSPRKDRTSLAGNGLVMSRTRRRRNTSKSSRSPDGLAQNLLETVDFGELLNATDNGMGGTALVTGYGCWRG